MSKFVQIDATLDKGACKETSICVLGINMSKNISIWVGQLMEKDQEDSWKNNE